MKWAPPSFLLLLAWNPALHAEFVLQPADGEGVSDDADRSHAIQLFSRADDASMDPAQHLLQPIQHQFWVPKTLYLYWRDKALADAIEGFCKMQSVDVVLSQKLQQNPHKLNQSFTKEFPVRIWEQLVKSCGLMWFYDGHVLYVYESGETQTEVLKVHPRHMDLVLETIQSMGFKGSNMRINPMREGGILIVTGAPKMIELLQSITGNMQLYSTQEMDLMDIRVFHLKHAWADDKDIGSLRIPGVATLLTRILGEKNTDDHALTSIEPTASIKKVDSVRKVEEDRQAADKKEGEETHTTEAPPAERTLPDGGVITTDARQNAVIIKDYRRNLDLYDALIQKLDVPLELVEIQAAIINVSKNCGLQVGPETLSLVSHNQKHTIRYTTNSNVDLNSTQIASGANMAINGIVRGAEFMAAIHFLESKNLSKVLARPSVITMNNLTAVMDQSKTFYMEVKGNRGGDMYSVTGSTNLKVTPHVFLQDERMHIQLILDIKDESVSPGTDKEKPQTDSASISTQAVVYEGQSVLIGGYFTEDYVRGERGIPLLKDLPLLGNLFKSSSKTKAISERLFLITPKIIHLSVSDHQRYQRLFDTASKEALHKELAAVQSPTLEAPNASSDATSHQTESASPVSDPTVAVAPTQANADPLPDKASPATSVVPTPETDAIEDAIESGNPYDENPDIEDAGETVQNFANRRRVRHLKRRIKKRRAEQFQTIET